MRTSNDRIVVIGSGPCGAVAADELVRRGMSVTLLESGTARPRGLVMKAAGRTVLRWRPTGTLATRGFHADADPETVWLRDLRPGGLSNHWTAAVPRFAPEDFGHGVDVDPTHRWPLTYDDLQPFYDWVEGLMGVTGGVRPTRNLPVAQVKHRVGLPPGWDDLVEPAAALGHDLVPMPMAKGDPWMIARRGTEFNSWSTIVERLRRSPAFEVRTGAHVRRLRWSSSSGRVDAVEYLDRNRGEVRQLGGDAFVVAAGALNSTRLLLSSTCSDFPTGLGDSHGVLGRYLHDHTREWWTFETDRMLALPAHPVCMTRRTLDEGNPLLTRSWTIGLASERDRLKTFVGLRGNRFGVQVFGTMVPTPDHRVTLDGGPADALGQRPLRISIAYDDAARDNVLTARDRLREVFAKAGCTVTFPPRPPFRLRPGESVHYGGSVRMHARPDHGVVDGACRLHAVPNVLVVDTSVFTTGPEKNPTLTAMAIAARAASRLADEAR